MALSVATNTSAATAHRYLKTNDIEASRSLAKLSSGSRILRPPLLAASPPPHADLNALRHALRHARHNTSLWGAVGALPQGALPRAPPFFL